MVLEAEVALVVGVNDDVAVVMEEEQEEVVATKMEVLVLVEQGDECMWSKCWWW